MFNPSSSLQDVYKYESSAVNVAMTIDGAADLAGAAGILGRKAVQAVTKSFAEDSVGITEKTFNILGKQNIAEDMANEPGGKLALPEPEKLLALPAPEEKLALPGSEERLALPEPEEVSNSVTNSKGISYPEVTDLKTGKPMEFPNGELIRVPKDERVGWYRNQSEADLYRENDTDILCKEDFIDEWYRRGYSDPPLDWKEYDIHHITPREFGGDSSFENLTPVERGTHQSQVTPWWNAYDK